MSKVIFTLLVLSFCLVFVLLFFIIGFTLALLIFSQKGKKEKGKVISITQKRRELENTSCDAP